MSSYQVRPDKDHDSRGPVHVQKSEGGRKVRAPSPRRPASMKYTTDSPSGARPWTHRAQGYARFAAFIANDPDKSTTIYRRFDRLSARNLLYLESELAQLEAELDELDDEGEIEGEGLQSSAQSWEQLQLQAQFEEQELREKANIRVHKIRELREKIKEYYEALKLASDIMAFNTPNSRALKGARRVFKTNRDMKTGNEMIVGPMERHLDVDKDLCVLAAPQNPDRLTRLFEGQFAWLFREQSDDDLSGIILHRKVENAVSFISTVCAAIFLIGAILGLYFVTNSNARLGMLSGFTVAFAASLALLTNARRQDVFAATAAYAAVLVVFVSGNLAASYNTPASGSPPSIVQVTSTRIATATVTISTSAPSSVSVTSIPSSSNQPSSSSGGLSRGAIAGIVAGALTATGIFVTLLLYFLFRRRQKTRFAHAPSPTGPPTPYVPSREILGRRSLSELPSAPREKPYSQTVPPRAPAPNTPRQFLASEQPPNP